MSGQSNTDVTQLFVIMATAIFGTAASEIIGHYLLIVFAASTGAAWSLGKVNFKNKASAVWYFLRIDFTAILLTVAISKIAVGFLPALEVGAMTAPVALIIGLIGDDWKKVGAWVITVFKRIINQKIDDKRDER